MLNSKSPMDGRKDNVKNSLWIYHKNIPSNDQIFKKSYMIFAEITIKVKLAIDVSFSAFG